MKITESQLRKIVREEAVRASRMNEQSEEYGSFQGSTSSAYTVAFDLLGVLERAEDAGIFIEAGSGIMSYRQSGGDALELDVEGPGGDMVTYRMTISKLS